MKPCKESIHGYKKRSGHYCFLKPIGGEWLVHRWVYSTKVGPIPVGSLVLHECGNAGCIEETHLYLGTHKDNTSDSLRHGTHSNQKLSVDQVKEIRKKFEFKTQKELAEEYNVSKRTIEEITRRASWVHL